MDINISDIKKGVSKLKVGLELNEALAKEVFKMKQANEIKEVKDIITGNVIGKSNWTTVDDTPIILPNFSQVVFVGILILEDLDSEVNIKRKKGGKYEIKFLNGSNVRIKGESFPEVVARGALFEQRYKEAVKKKSQMIS